MGITCSNIPTFDAHAMQTLAKCKRGLYLIRQLKKYCNYQQILHIYTSAIVISHLRYAVSVWGPFISQKSVDSINALLRFACRAGCLSKKLTFADILQQSDEKLFGKVTAAHTHPLRVIMPSPRVTNYKLRKPTFNIRKFKYKTTRNHFIYRKVSHAYIF